jgi:hypothetical protein
MIRHVLADRTRSRSLIVLTAKRTSGWSRLASATIAERQVNAKCLAPQARGGRVDKCAWNDA